MKHLLLIILVSLAICTNASTNKKCETCDVITLQSKESFFCEIIETTKNRIKYKPCGKEGEIVEIPKKDAISILYRDGKNIRNAQNWGFIIKLALSFLAIPLAVLALKLMS